MKNHLLFNKIQERITCVMFVRNSNVSGKEMISLIYKKIREYIKIRIALMFNYLFKYSESIREM